MNTIQLETIAEDLLYDNEEDEVLEKVMDFLSNQDSFRGFGEGLSCFIEKRMSKEFASPKDYLVYMAEQNGTPPFNRGTLANWFDKEKRPRHDKKAREHAYRICFALKLSISETKDFFLRVFHERPFYFREVSDFVYYYCRVV